MRFLRFIPLVSVAVLAVPVYAQPAVTLGADSGCGALPAGSTCTLTARVTGLGSGPAAAVTWSPDTPSPQGATYGNPIGPDATGLTTRTYTAPSSVTTKQTVTVTVSAVGQPSLKASVQITLIPLIGIGSGSPTFAMQDAFLQAYNRGTFASQVSLPPIAAVRALGSGGYVQEFQDATKSGAKLALESASLTLGSTGGYATYVMQLPATLYAYYTQVGSGTAGYPLIDGTPCPVSDPNNACVYATFDKGYALFSYTNPLVEGQNFSVNGAFYTEWTTLGGITGAGAAIGAQTTITASSIAPATTGTTATAQNFSGGAIYSITSGANKGKTFGVIQPVYDLYTNQSGPNGSLGLPISDVIQISTGVYRQNFEGGAVQYTSASAPVILFPVAAVRVTGPSAAGTISLNLGQTATLTASPIDNGGNPLSDRPISWSTSNSKVISIQASGATAVVTAVGGGAASVQASSGGVASSKLNFVVIAPCCQIGEGAPAAVQQSFQDALSRNKITPALPAQSPVQRVANGYLQMVQSADSNAPGGYMIAQSDQLGAAYVVSGAVLARYQALGGPGGSLGYPIGDASAGGTQLFANSAALGGNPVRLVNGILLSKWTLLGRDSGVAGVPVAEAAAFATFGANSGQMQAFAGGTIYGATGGPRAGQAYFTTGAILTRYSALGGPEGDFGMPISDEFANGGLRQQNFEGGNITYAVGTPATEHPIAKTPGVVAPASVAAGERVRLALTGFGNNSTLRVSVTGQSDFVVTSANGSFAWEMFIPLTEKSGTLRIHAADTKSAAAADGAVTVKGFADNRIQISKIQGDNQSGPPGAVLPLPLRMALRDSAGNPIIGAAVTFEGSAGTALSTATATTDASGAAEVWVRLPAVEGVSGVRVDVPSIAQAPVTFFVRAAASSLSNFPRLMQTEEEALGSGPATIAQKGALLASVASILRYRQNRGELPSPNGSVDTSALNQFLKSYCTVDVRGNQLCDGFVSNGAGAEQVVNLWRAAEFTGRVDVVPQAPTLAAAADLVAQGSPALLSLALTLNGAAAGGHFVVAIGIAADGSILIHDPNPALARGSLSEYIAGFNAASGAWKGELRGVAGFLLRSPSASRFLLAAVSQPPDVMKGLTLTAQSAAGVCGQTLEMLDAVDGSGKPAAGVLVSRMGVCDGSQAVYQLSVGAALPFRAFVTDLTPAGASFDLSGSAVGNYQASRPQLNLTLAPLTVSIAPAGVVNAATFTAGIAPGGIVAIFGSGLSGPGLATTVEVDGVAALVLGATPFQVNAVIPLETASGNHLIRVRSAFGAAEQPVSVSAVAPAIFLIGAPAAGAVVNQDSSLNTSSNPASRGQVLVIYATGLGAVTSQGQFLRVTTPVTVLLNGQELSVEFAGAAPGYPGLYQVNVAIPSATPPGLAVGISLKQGQQLSNSVPIALQ